MPDFFTTVILRKFSDHNPSGIIRSIARQVAVRQIIVVGDGADGLHDLRHVTPLQAEESNAELLFVEINPGVGDCAILACEPLVKYEPVVLWDTFAPMPERLVERLLNFYRPDKLVGLAGFSLEGLNDWLKAGVHRLVESETPVQCLEPRGMMLHRKFLRLPFTHYSDRYQHHLSLWVCSNAIFNHGASCSVVPAASATQNTTVCQQSSFSTVSPDLYDLEIDFAIAYLNSGRPYSDWPEINVSILPQIEDGSHFETLPPEPYRNLLVFGCQRSGTTWFAKCVGKYFPNAFTFTEEQTFHLLLDNYSLPAIHAQNLVFQTTFVSTVVRSYQACRPNTRFILMLRNPFSVCYSLLHNFQLLGEVYAYLKTRMSSDDFIDGVEGSLKMALEIYRHNMRCNLELLSLCAERTHAVIYEEAIVKPKEILKRLAGFLDMLAPEDSPVPQTDVRYLTKWHELPQENAKLIERFGVPLWNEVLSMISRKEHI